MKKALSLFLSVLIMIPAIAAAGSAAGIVISDSPVYIGVWREEGDLTGNITHIGSSVLSHIRTAGDISLSRKDVVSVDLPENAYTLADGDETVITLKEGYLKERKNGHNAFDIEFKDIRLTVTYFVLKDKTVGNYSFNAYPRADGTVHVVLNGIPATVPDLLDKVTLDGKEIDKTTGITVRNPFNTLMIGIGPELLVYDGKPHVFRFTFTNLDSVNITFYPYTTGECAGIALPVIPGDIDGDTKISAGDARLALRYTAKLDKPYEYSDLPDVLYDINSDGRADAADARMILRISAKLDPIPEKLRVTVPEAYEYILSLDPFGHYKNSGALTLKAECDDPSVQIIDRTITGPEDHSFGILPTKKGVFDIRFTVTLDGNIISNIVWSVTVEKDLDSF